MSSLLLPSSLLQPLLCYSQSLAIALSPLHCALTRSQHVAVTCCLALRTRVSSVVQCCHHSDTFDILHIYCTLLSSAHGIATLHCVYIVVFRSAPLLRTNTGATQRLSLLPFLSIVYILLLLFPIFCVFLICFTSTLCLFFLKPLQHSPDPLSLFESVLPLITLLFLFGLAIHVDTSLFWLIFCVRTILLRCSISIQFALFVRLMESQ